jgi:hypothetical protein
MISIDQLLESVDLDFEPRWVTKDESGDITIFLHKPIPEGWCAEWRGRETKYECLGRVKLAEFADKPWQECIYEVPRKTTGKIEQKMLAELERKLNAIVDAAIEAVNEFKGAKNE